MKTFDTSWYVEQEQRIHDATRPKVGEYLGLPAAPKVGLGHIYVIEFSSGVLKVGRSINPNHRLGTHTRIARVHGVTVLQSWISARHPGCDGTERRLIDYCRQWGEQIDAEYFRGVAFDDAQFIASRLADDAARRAYVDRLVEAADGDLSMPWLEAHGRLGTGEELPS